MLIIFAIFLKKILRLMRFPKDKIMLKTRGVIQSVGAVLKEDYNIEHSRYRSPITLLVNVFSVLAAYIFRENKPSIYKKARNVIMA